jgi:flagellar protein FliS
MKAYGEQQYRNLNVETVDKAKLVVMLYEGAISALNSAAACIRNEDVSGKCSHINTASDIIQELNFALDMEIGGEVATNLRSLYQFMTRQLVKAKVQRGGSPEIEKVVEMLNSLLEAWQSIRNDPEVVEMLQQNNMANPALSVNRGIRV